jgi:hypothetical protein
MSQEIRFDEISSNHEFRAKLSVASVALSADEATAQAVREVPGVTQARVDGDGSIYFMIGGAGVNWPGLRDAVVTAIKRGQRWTGSVTVRGF